MKKLLNEFKAFALKGNVIDMAVGVVIGGAFTAIVTSIVENLLTPIVGLCIPNSTFADWAPGGFGIGAVLNAIITFIITALVLFAIVKGINKMRKPKVEPAKPAPRTCPFCMSEIAEKATRCPHCTSQLELLNK